MTVFDGRDHCPGQGVTRLVGIHTDSKGTVSWVKVVETWNSLELPTRTKASLSSKWSDIKSRATVLNSIKEQDNAGLCTTPKINAWEQPTDVNGTQVVNTAVKSIPTTKSPVVTGTNIPVLVKNSLNTVNTGVTLRWVHIQLLTISSHSTHCRYCFLYFFPICDYCLRLYS